MRSGFLPGRIVHLHPTRLCNLACLHCYSSSDRTQRAALDPALLCRGLEFLRAEGYEQVSVSGGEPLVYGPLKDVLRHARALGYRTTLISNGLLVAERNDDVLPLLDGMAISFDGLAATHDRMRGRAGTFAAASAAVRHVIDRGLPVAAAISVTPEGIAELPDLAVHLVGLGVRTLQVRPVTFSGRAQELGSAVAGTDADRLRLFLVATALQQELPAGTQVHCDLSPSQWLRQQRDDYAALERHGAPDSSDLPLSDLVNPVVITETGMLRPLTYEFDARFDIGTLADLGTERLTAYKRKGFLPLKRLLAGALAGLEHRTDLVDWFDHCTRLGKDGHRSMANG